MPPAGQLTAKPAWMFSVVALAVIELASVLSRPLPGSTSAWTTRGVTAPLPRGATLSMVALELLAQASVTFNAPAANEAVAPEPTVVAEPNVPQYSRMPPEVES